MGSHIKLGKGRTAAQNRAEKEQRVHDGLAHAALVFSGEHCLGWCQFGSPAELPQVKSRRLYEQGLDTLPDWHVTCFFTGKGHRRRGVADAALGGALAEIARYGGGTVEGYPEETDERTLSGSFLNTGPMAAFAHHGFTRAAHLVARLGHNPYGRASLTRHFSAHGGRPCTTAPSNRERPIPGPPVCNS